jgi:hypothetical protein
MNDLEQRLAERVGHNIAEVLPHLGRRAPRIRKLARIARATPNVATLAALADEIGNTPASLLAVCGAFTIRGNAAIIERADVGGNK